MRANSHVISTSCLDAYLAPTSSNPRRALQVRHAERGGGRQGVAGQVLQAEFVCLVGHSAVARIRLRFRLKPER